jgi:hypothetical protein
MDRTDLLESCQYYDKNGDDVDMEDCYEPGAYNQFEEEGRQDFLHNKFTEDSDYDFVVDENYNMHNTEAF